MNTVADGTGVATMRIHALLNKESGTLRTVDLADLAGNIERSFVEQGHAIEIMPVKASDFDRSLEQSAESGEADTILIAGGDGSVSAAAAACHHNDKILGVLPAGTMNLFARSLGIPLDLDEAIGALARGTVGTSDIALVNGRPFVHQFSVGLHPNMAEERRRHSYRSRLTKMLASLNALLAQFRRPPAFQLTMELPDRRSSHLLSALSVSNNPFGPGHMPYADRLDSGQLGIYTAGVLSRGAYLRLTADLFAGTWPSNEDLVEERSDRVTLEFSALRRRTSSALIDGELTKLERHVEIRCVSGGLRTLLPARED